MMLALKESFINTWSGAATLHVNSYVRKQNAACNADS